MLSTLRSCEPERTTLEPSSSSDARELGLLTSLADFYDRELVATIGWAKQVSLAETSSSSERYAYSLLC